MTPTEKELLKKARITAVTLGGFCIIALLSLVYAIFQKTKSDQSEAMRLAQESKSAMQIEMVRTKLEATMTELEKCRQK